MKKFSGKHSWFSKGMSALLAGSMVVTTAFAAPQIFNVFDSEAQAGSKKEQYELLDEMQDASILHCWNWSYKTIEQNLELIAECGYSAIQTSPAQQPKDYSYEGLVGTDVGTPGEGGTGNWWKLYQPVTFNVCNNGQSWLGTKEELESLCDKAEEYGIKVVVDIVANHMGNIKGWKNELSDVSPQVGEYYLADMLRDESYWHINKAQIWMSDSRYHFTQGTMGMPDLNTQDKRVQMMVANYLDELIDCGVDGFRFDAAKHIETPDDDAEFAGDFWPTVLNEARAHCKKTTGNDLYVYGEILNTVGLDFSIDSYTKYMSVTDNSAGNHLLESFRNNNVGTLNMDYDPSVSVLWAESHDTYMNESSRYASDKSIMRTWAMVANKDNAAKLFFARPYYSADTLVNDQDGNFKGNLKNTLKQAKMGNCETYVWASKEAAAINHFNNRFHNDADDMGADGNKAYCRRGNGIVIVNFDGPGYVSMSAHGMSDGSYVDEVSGNKFVVEQGQLFGEITSEYGIAVVYQNVMSNPSENYPVQISVDKGDGTKFYGDSLDVVATAKYATTATYKLSTGETGKVGDNTVINLGNGLKKGETVTLTITASNKSGKKTESYTYVKDEYDLTNCIFFKNTNGWSAVTAYIWSEGGKTSVKNAGWPGEQMYECDPVNHIFALKIDDSLGYTNIIFSNNGASQTKDIAIGQVGYMYNPSTNEWTQYKNQPVKKFPTVSATKDSQTFKDSIEVTYTVNNATKATITIDGKSEEFTGSITKKFTERTVVDITALNNDGETTKSYVYTKVYDEAIVNITEDCTFTTDTMDVEINVFNADKAYYQIDGGNKVEFTDSVTVEIGKNAEPNQKITVKVTAENAAKVATTKTSTFEKKVVVPVEERTIYFNAIKCSWFANDKAVAAIRTEDSTAFVKMNAIINNAGETVYTFDIPKKSSMVTIGRMLPSGNVYNEKVITLDATKDYYLSDSNWSNVSVKMYTNEVVYTEPTITVDKDSCEFENSITVNVSVKDAQTSEYVLNGSKVSFKDSTAIRITKDSILVINAVNGDKTKSKTCEYKLHVEVPVEEVTVYFTNNVNWSNVYAYTWGSSKKSVQWPGQKMTLAGTNQYGEKVYKITVPKDVKGLIFTNGNGAQTADITKGINENAGFYISGNGAKANVGTYTFSKSQLK